MNKKILGIVLAVVVVAVGIWMMSGSSQKSSDPKAFLQTYADIALDSYNASYDDAMKLQKAIHAFADEPNQANLDEAKKIWLMARESYGVTEIFRLSEGPIDAEEGWVSDAYGNLEGQINAWPLDENLIDYTMDADQKRTSGNIIDSTGVFTPGGKDVTPVDITTIDKDVLSKLNENGSDENVSAGWHSMEFLLWGQDQDYNNLVEDKITNGPMVAGQRPLSDFTTDKFAKRRLQYLVANADKMLEDIGTVRDAWLKKVDGNKGLYRAAFLGQLTGDNSEKNIPMEQALRQVFVGMGMFLKSELANERIAVAVLTPSEEDEHSCFSDNTHRDIYTNFKGFTDALYGKYNGKKVGTSAYDFLPSQEKNTVDGLVEDIDARIAKVDELAKTKMHFDYQILPQNKDEAKNLVTMKNEMRKLGDQMVTVAKAFGVSITEEDVRDPEENLDWQN